MKVVDSSSTTPTIISKQLKELLFFCLEKAQKLFCREIMPHLQLLSAKRKINDIFDVVDNILHVLVDVMPYYEWGNEENDTTPFSDRVSGPDWGPKLDSAIKKFFSPEDPIENIQKNIDEMFRKYRKNVKSNKS